VAIRRTRPEGRRAIGESSGDATLGNTAIAYLARRDYASGELAQKLESDGYGREAVAALVAELLSTRVLNDERYAEHFVAAHAGRGQGPFRIRQELRVRGVPPETVQAALDAGPDWHALARRVRQSKFGAEPPVDPGEKARQARFLQYRGFSTDHIRSALGRDLDP
jgi:regulatory protein